MHEVKGKGLTITVYNLKLTSDVIIAVSCKLAGNDCVFNKLKCDANSHLSEEKTHTSEIESTIVGYAIYLAVNQFLCGDAFAMQKSKVSGVGCSLKNDVLTLTWKVKGTTSAVRKSLGMCLKTLDPSKVFSIYSGCAKQLGITPNRDHFNYVADLLLKSIKDDLNVIIIGATKISKDDLSKIHEIVIKKRTTNSIDGKKTKPDTGTKCDHSENGEVKINGWGSAVLSEYISSKQKGLEPSSCCGKLVVPIKEAQWKTLASKLKNDIQTYVETRYAKLGDDLPGILCYLHLSQEYISGLDAKEILTKKISSKDITNMLNKVL
jgi:DNA-directed RNA polymerase subunit F